MKLRISPTALRGNKKKYRKRIFQETIVSNWEFRLVLQTKFAHSHFLKIFFGELKNIIILRSKLGREDYKDFFKVEDETSILMHI